MDYDRVFIRVIDYGGCVWESKGGHESMDAALADMEAGIKGWCEEHGIELILEDLQ